MNLAYTMIVGTLLLWPSSVTWADHATNVFFPLMAWNSAPSDPAALRQMRDCGLTVAGFAAPRDLDLCQAAGLKAIVSDPRVSHYDWTGVDEATARKNVSSLVAEVNHHPVVYGYCLRDEPGAEMFPGLAKSHPCSPQFRNPPRRVRMVSPFSGQLTGFDGEQRWLAPGQGVLMKLEN